MSNQAEKVPVIFVELCDQRPSGFILDGTAGTKHEVELKAPLISYIPNEGFRRGKKTETVNGKKVETKYNEKIRYIKNEAEISFQKQRELGIEKNPQAREDKIIIEKGYLTVAREGASVGLYDFLLESYYNETNLERSEKATALYRVVELDKKVESENDDAEIEADAVSFVTSLRDKVGESYKYQETKIDVLCELFNVVAETYPVKIKTLISLARNNPKFFLDKAKKLSLQAVTEVTHGLQLLVIDFEENVAVYTTKKKVIKNLGSGKYTHDQKVTMLADYFGTKEGFEAYNEFKAELELAKEKAIK